MRLAREKTNAIDVKTVVMTGGRSDLGRRPPGSFGKTDGTRLVLGAPSDTTTEGEVLVDWNSL